MTRVTVKQEKMALCEAQSELQEAGKALVLTEPPTLYLPSANLHCQGLGADSVPSRITTSCDVTEALWAIRTVKRATGCIRDR